MHALSLIAAANQLRINGTRATVEYINCEELLGFSNSITWRSDEVIFSRNTRTLMRAFQLQLYYMEK